MQAQRRDGGILQLIRNAAQDVGVWSAQRSGPYLWYRRLGGLRGRSAQHGKSRPPPTPPLPRFFVRTVHPVVSHYTVYARPGDAQNLYEI